jgi:putative hydrolase of the HAD superfamily
LQTAFNNAYKAESKAYPNYGREMVLRGEYGGPKQWWTGVIKATFANSLDKPDLQLPAGLVDRLIDTFASKEGYLLYEDVQPFFDQLRRYKTHQSGFDCVVTGIISNSDDRVSTVLRSLGLLVGRTRADEDRPSTLLLGFEEAASKDPQDRGFYSDDLNMVITSYEAGQEKPNRLIYDVAARQVNRLLSTYKWTKHDMHNIDWTRVHVGDDFTKDYQGATDAGWHGILLDRDNTFTDSTDVEIINSLETLLPKIQRYATS